MLPYLNSFPMIEPANVSNSLQELILSSIYVVETVRSLRGSLRPQQSHQVLHQLILVNVIIVLMDVGLVSLEIASLYLLQIIVKGFIYSVKLKLEFAILTRLVTYVGGDSRNPSNAEFVNTRRSRSMSFVQMVDHDVSAKTSSTGPTLPDYVHVERVPTSQVGSGPTEVHDITEVEPKRRRVPDPYGDIDSI